MEMILLIGWMINVANEIDQLLIIIMYHLFHVLPTLVYMNNTSQGSEDPRKHAGIDRTSRCAGIFQALMSRKPIQ